MALTNKQKSIIATVLGIVLLLIVVSLAGGSKQTSVGNQDTQTDQIAPVAQTPAAEDDAETIPETTEATAEEAEEAAEETTEAPALSPEGLYTAECFGSAGTMYGEVEVDADDDPAKEKSVDIKNMNTGKSTKVDLATTRCTFTPKS